ncbi:MAG TPA: hypothetical protein VIO14_11040 [Dehalococcoidia bacterium]
MPEEPGGDWLLASFVGGVNMGSLEMGVTLLVHGAVVSGRLMPAREYLTRLGDDLSAAASQAGTPEVGEQIRTQLHAVADELYPQGAPSQEPGDEAEGPAFIHLKDVVLVPADGRAGFRLPYWRGRVDAVDGWFFGQISPGQA